jgi:hypothetical protein
MPENELQLARVAALEQWSKNLKDKNYLDILQESFRRLDEESRKTQKELIEATEEESDQKKLSYYNKAKRFLGPKKFSQLQGADRSEIEEAFKNYDDPDIITDLVEAIIQPPSQEILILLQTDEKLWEKRVSLSHAIQMIELGNEVILTLERNKSFLRSGVELSFDDEGNVSASEVINPDLRRAFDNWQQLLANARGEKGRAQHPFVRFITAIMAMECGIGANRFKDELQIIAQNCYEQAAQMLKP